MAYGADFNFLEWMTVEIKSLASGGASAIANLDCRLLEIDEKASNPKVAQSPGLAARSAFLLCTFR